MPSKQPQAPCCAIPLAGRKTGTRVTFDGTIVLRTRLTRKHAAHALVVQTLGTVDDDHALRQMFRQAFDGLGFTRVRRAPQVSAEPHVHGRGQRQVTPVGQRADDQPAGIAHVFVSVQLFRVRLFYGHVVRLFVPVKSQLRHPFEREHVRTVCSIEILFASCVILILCVYSLFPYTVRMLTLFYSIGPIRR